MGDSSQSSYQLVIAGFQPQTHSLVQAVFVISKYVWKPSSCPGLQNAPCVDIMRGETVYVRGNLCKSTIFASINSPSTRQFFSFSRRKHEEKRTLGSKQRNP